MKRTYNQILQEDIRQNVLSLLNDDADYSHNEFVLKSALKHLGHNVSHDRLRTELAWLEEQGCVTLEEVSGIVVATLTARGQDVATGAVRIPGIAKTKLV